MKQRKWTYLVEGDGKAGQFNFWFVGQERRITAFLRFKIMKAIAQATGGYSRVVMYRFDSTLIAGPSETLKLWEVK